MTKDSNIARFFSKRWIKMTLGVILFLIGVRIILYDSFTYFPYVFMFSGILICFASYHLKESKYFYLFVLILYYLPSSLYNETMIKRYNVEITLPPHKNRFYFIASNNWLKWKDCLLTWFKSEEIRVSFNEETVVYLNRSIPYNYWDNSDSLFSRGYTSLTVIGNKKNDYIVLIPIANREFYLNKIDFKYSYRHQVQSLNSRLFEKLIEYKIDSIEKDGIH
jgi:hypothetical protein